MPAHPGDYLGDLPRTGAGIRDDDSPSPAPEHSSLLGLPNYRAHLERTFRLGTGPNGVFGAKLMWRHLPELQKLAAQLPEYTALEPLELLSKLFDDPHYVWVTRRDKVRQAVSLWRALQTRAWRLEPGAEERANDLRYSFEGIDHLARSLQADDDAWRRFFETAALPVLQVVYEDQLARDQERTVHAVLEHIGVRAPAGWRPVEVVRRQADVLSEQWVASYHRDAGRKRTGATRPALSAR